MKRLSFQLPDFFRHAWVSDNARVVWEPRFKAVSYACSQLQWLTVARGMRFAGLSRFRPETLVSDGPRWVKRGIGFLPLAVESQGTSEYQSRAQSYAPGSPCHFVVGFGSEEVLLELAAAFKKGNDDRVGELFGYPSCCRAFFNEVWNEQGFTDSTWSMAEATAGCTFVRKPRTETIRVPRPALTNVLLRGFGVRAVYHLPCSFSCAKSVEFAERLMAIGRDEGFAREMDWLGEILSWPIEWSALHGIAEIKTPVLKCSMNTDATPSLYRVVIEGSSMPEEAAIGLGEIYRHPKRSPLTAIERYRRDQVKTV
jgi:hypothetical protein